MTVRETDAVALKALKVIRRLEAIGNVECKRLAHELLMAAASFYLHCKFVNRRMKKRLLARTA